MYYLSLKKKFYYCFLLLNAKQHKILFSLCEYYCFMSENSTGYVKHIKSNMYVCFGKTGAYIRISHCSYGYLLSPFKAANQWPTKPIKTVYLSNFQLKTTKSDPLKMCHYYVNTVISSISGFPDETERELYRNAMRIISDCKIHN